MNWPQALAVGRITAEVWVWALYHGEPRPPYNALTKLADAGLWLGILYWGGFFARG